MEKGYWFKSDLFKIQAGEDEVTNPFCFGKELAEWLCLKLKKLGYEADVIPEDWGWCVMCVHDDYSLWVGCGIIQDEDSLESYDPEKPPTGREVVWHIFSHIEVPFFMFKSLIRKWTGKLDTKSPLIKLRMELEEILTKEKRIKLCKEP